MAKSRKIKKHARARRPKMNSVTGYGILNPYGDMWSPHVFPTVVAAKNHVRDFWSGVKGHDLSLYRIVRARQACHFVKHTSDNLVQ